MLLWEHFDRHRPLFTHSLTNLRFSYTQQLVFISPLPSPSFVSERLSKNTAKNTKCNQSKRGDGAGSHVDDEAGGRGDPERNTESAQSHDPYNITHRYPHSPFSSGKYFKPTRSMSYSLTSPPPAPSRSLLSLALSLNVNNAVQEKSGKKGFKTVYKLVCEQRNKYVYIPILRWTHVTGKKKRKTRKRPT